MYTNLNSCGGTFQAGTFQGFRVCERQRNLIPFSLSNRTKHRDWIVLSELITGGSEKFHASGFGSWRYGCNLLHPKNRPSMLSQLRSMCSSLFLKGCSPQAGGADVQAAPGLALGEHVRKYKTALWVMLPEQANYITNLLS